jgi:D-serine deaminase-like pyridoxal phosphate-dependent protein
LYRLQDLSVETPTLLVDLDRVERNLDRMQSLANSNGKALRPHAKTHKSVALAHAQVRRGAAGICAQKVGEAQVFALGGLRDILISNEVLGSPKARRIAGLISAGHRISVAVDSVKGIKVLEDAAEEFGVEVQVLLDVDVGMHRCGVDPNDVSLVRGIVKALRNSHRVRLEGLMGYDGHTSRIRDGREREEEVRRGWMDLMRVAKVIKEEGGEVNTISVGGTPSAHIWANLEGVTELQPGTYIYNDVHQVELGVASIEDVAALVLAQVISKGQDRVVLDVGTKGVAVDQGVYPEVVSHEGVKVVSMSEEHAVLKGEGVKGMELEERVVLAPYHVCPTIDLWDEATLVKGGKAVGVLRIDARGRKD